MDDVIIIGNSPTQVQQFVHQLQALFALQDLGNSSYFLGLELNTTPQGVLLSQQKYITEIFHKAHMGEAKPRPTPMVKGVSLLAYVETIFDDPHLYRCIVGSLQYAIISSPEIRFVVNQVSQFMQHPLEPHWKVVKHILCYLRGTSDHGLLFNSHSSLKLVALFDANWASNLNYHKSSSR